VIDRARFLALSGAAATLAAVPRAARADGPVRAVTLPFDQGAQLYYAQDLGMFKRAALEVVVSTANYGTQVASAVAGGAVEIGQSNIMSLAAAIERGLPFALIAAGGLYSSTKPTSLSAWADQNGGDSTLIKFVEMPFVEMEPALATGRIDAALMADPDATTALAAGRTRPFAKAFDAIGKQFLIGGWFAKTDWIAANADAVKKFVAVMRESAIWANNPANYKQSAAILEKYTKVAVGSANRIAFGDRLDPALIQPNIDVAAKYGLLKASFPATKLISSAGT
jgi:NitT/TauT family transport system substrate-binding protein